MRVPQDESSPVGGTGTEFDTEEGLKAAGLFPCSASLFLLCLADSDIVRALVRGEGRRTVTLSVPRRGARGDA